MEKASPLRWGGGEGGLKMGGRVVEGVREEVGLAENRTLSLTLSKRTC